uniref:Homing endonuclease LAGLIDADG domain-containing protein n=1 Tax=Tremella fuciformis TaxID=64657 RepID=A0A2H4QBW2_9TREE|nr:hypothetical protein [Tremella fuciformis]ATX61977.1 hypothetical protein [Tremella fuciformis]ATX62022.1 hypothetical protein [Tremella fuciformis]ATX62068.1 hypothetical protein [Tremella fuciformis]ATX62113.1 hypothetical protein [Tremella fuciformis]
MKKTVTKAVNNILFVDIVWLFLYAAVYWWGSDGVFSTITQSPRLDSSGHSIIGAGLMMQFAVLAASLPAASNYLTQAMTGLMLGDGTLVKKYVSGGTYFKFAQGMVHQEYLEHVFNLFKVDGLVKMRVPSVGKTVLNGVTHKWLQFSTISLSRWNELHALWYVNGVKTIPGNIEELLTPVRLAYWFMDDGGWTKTGIHLATNSFTPEDTLRLIKVLESVYGLKCTLHSRNRIYIWSRSCPDFINIVRPHMHSSMGYKLQPKS